MRLSFDCAILISILAGFIVQQPATIVASYAICVVLFLIKAPEFSLRRKYLYLYSLIFVFLLIPTLTFNHDETPIFYLFLSPFLFLLAYNFSRNSLAYICYVLQKVYWLFVLFIVVAFLLNWDEPEPLGAIFPWASTNGIPSYLIVVQIAYSIAFYLERGRLPIISSAATMVVAIAGLGRGSIVIGAAIIFLSFMINLLQTKRKVYGCIVLIIGLLTFISFLMLSDSWVEQIIRGVEAFVETSKFSTGIFDEHRGRMLGDYVDKIDALSLILGANYEGTSINQYYGGNPHNSFIRLHSFYGLIGIFFIFAPLVLLLISRRDFMQKLVVAMFVFLALARATTEPIFFPTVLDFFYFLYFFVFFRFSIFR